MAGIETNRIRGNEPDRRDTGKAVLAAILIGKV
jgi:hypothetical protein